HASQENLIVCDRQGVTVGDGSGHVHAPSLCLHVVNESARVAVGVLIVVEDVPRHKADRLRGRLRVVRRVNSVSPNHYRGWSFRFAMRKQVVNLLADFLFWASTLREEYSV